MLPCNEWKIARVVPILKIILAALKYSVSGYRPISILPTVSKILEHHVSRIIHNHICEACPISDRQWGFMHEPTLLHFCSDICHSSYDWLSALNNSQEDWCVWYSLMHLIQSLVYLLQKLE